MIASPHQTSYQHHPWQKLALNQSGFPSGQKDQVVRGLQALCRFPSLALLLLLMHLENSLVLQPQAFCRNRASRKPSLFLQPKNLAKE